ncbi:MAG: hypothetical protein R2881_05170 [Eubacteriales bacterium]
MPSRPTGPGPPPAETVNMAMAAFFSQPCCATCVCAVLQYRTAALSVPARSIFARVCGGSVW